MYLSRAATSLALGSLCVFALALGGNALAQSATEESEADDLDLANEALRPSNPSIERGVAFVSLNRIFKESKYVEARLSDVNSEFSEREQELEAKIEQLSQARETHSRDRLTMTAAERSTETDKLNELEIEIQREGRNLTEDKRLRFDSAQRELEIFVLEKIQDVSSEKENFIVFDLSSILFADTRLEITDEVIMRLDSLDPASEATSDEQQQ